MILVVNAQEILNSLMTIYKVSNLDLPSSMFDVITVHWLLCTHKGGILNADKILSKLCNIKVYKMK